MSTTYDVFARKTYPEPLTYIGSVEAESDEDVVQVSLETFGPAEQWIEMIGVPRQAITVVFSEQKEMAR